MHDGYRPNAVIALKSCPIQMPPIMRASYDVGCVRPEIVIKSISHREGDDLRAQVLRPDGEKAASGASQYEGTAAIHFGAYKDGMLEAVVSFTPYDEDGTRTLSVYQLRGAATRPGTRGLGVGTTLVSAGIGFCRENNARLGAAAGPPPAHSMSVWASMPLAGSSSRRRGHIFASSSTSKPSRLRRAVVDALHLRRFPHT
ncbi:GNAT family N-acetyltransferase [Rhizobium phaseoli]|uniref:GNAT family N-acetyltransferase n=1 Tax=Rhizobium phaseoli TaxID=396 RepID=UPI003AABEC51